MWHSTDLARVDLGVAESIVVGTHVDGCCNQLYLCVSEGDDGQRCGFVETVSQASKSTAEGVCGLANESWRKAEACLRAASSHDPFSALVCRWGLHLIGWHKFFASRATFLSSFMRL